VVDPLVEHSLTLIRNNQAPSGAYIASPNFKTYHYAWFRDGTFTAYAMDVMGDNVSAQRFYEWSAQTISRHADAARELIAQVKRGEPVRLDQGLHTRYTLDGNIGQEDWANFQLDGFGTWLWGIVEHLRQTGDSASAARWGEPIALIAEYIAALWKQPNYDCWEESGDQVHISTFLILWNALHAQNS
jgi:GH15 family glucan-1,4-alpha-glucosidase